MTLDENKRVKGHKNSNMRMVPETEAVLPKLREYREVTFWLPLRV